MLFRSGLTDYVTKPIDENILYSTILKHFDSSINIIQKEKSPETTTDKIFNLDELRNISISDDEFVPKILRLFINQSSGIPEKLKTFIENKNYMEIGYTIHQIKPSLNHLSVDCTKTIIAKIEQNIHDKCNEEETLELAKQMIDILNILSIQLAEELTKYN